MPCTKEISYCTHLLYKCVLRTAWAESFWGGDIGEVVVGAGEGSDNHRERAREQHVGGFVVAPLPTARGSDISNIIVCVSVCVSVYVYVYVYVSGSAKVSVCVCVSA